MKVAPRDLGRFLRTAEASVAAVLFYGPDQGLVRERAVELITRLAGDVRDPFRVAELTPAQLKEDPVRLADDIANRLATFLSQSQVAAPQPAPPSP